MTTEELIAFWGAIICSQIWLTAERSDTDDSPADAPNPHEIREYINELRDCAVQFHNFQSLHEKIARILKSCISWLEVSEKAELEQLQEELERLRNERIA